MEKVETYLLSRGAKDMRFPKKDKALATVNGKALLMHQVNAVAPVADTLTVVAEENDRYHPSGLRTIGDNPKGLGPIGGLKTALEDQKKNGWILLLSVDLFGVRREWLQSLVERATFGAKVVLFNDGARYEPLCALYHHSIYDHLLDHLREGERSLDMLVASVMKRGLRAPEGWDEVVKIDAPEDLVRAEAAVTKA